MVDRQTEIEPEELPGLRWLDEQLGIDQTREMGDIVMMAMARDREERGSIKDRRSYAAMDRALARSQGIEEPEPEPEPEPERSVRRRRRGMRSKYQVQPVGVETEEQEENQPAIPELDTTHAEGGDERKTAWSVPEMADGSRIPRTVVGNLQYSGGGLVRLSQMAGAETKGKAGPDVAGVGLEPTKVSFHPAQFAELLALHLVFLLLGPLIGCAVAAKAEGKAGAQNLGLLPAWSGVSARHVNAMFGAQLLGWLLLAPLYFCAAVRSAPSEEWDEFTDAELGEAYYVSQRTQEVAWQKPAVFATCDKPEAVELLLPLLLAALHCVVVSVKYGLMPPAERSDRRLRQRTMLSLQAEHLRAWTRPTGGAAAASYLQTLDRELALVMHRQGFADSANLLTSKFYFSPTIVTPHPGAANTKELRSWQSKHTAGAAMEVIEVALEAVLRRLIQFSVEPERVGTHRRRLVQLGVAVFCLAHALAGTAFRFHQDALSEHSWLDIVVVACGALSSTALLCMHMSYIRLAALDLDQRQLRFELLAYMLQLDGRRHAQPRYNRFPLLIADSPPNVHAWMEARQLLAGFGEAFLRRTQLLAAGWLLADVLLVSSQIVLSLYRVDDSVPLWLVFLCGYSTVHSCAVAILLLKAHQHNSLATAHQTAFAVVRRRALRELWLVKKQPYEDPQNQPGTVAEKEAQPEPEPEPPKPEPEPRPEARVEPEPEPKPRPQPEPEPEPEPAQSEDPEHKTSVLEPEPEPETAEREINHESEPLELEERMQGGSAEAQPKPAAEPVWRRDARWQLAQLERVLGTAAAELTDPRQTGVFFAVFGFPVGAVAVGASLCLAVLSVVTAAVLLSGTGLGKTMCGPQVACSCVEGGDLFSVGTAGANSSNSISNTALLIAGGSMDLQSSLLTDDGADASFSSSGSDSGSGSGSWEEPPLEPCGGGCAGDGICHDNVCYSPLCFANATVVIDPWRSPDNAGNPPPYDDRFHTDRPGVDSAAFVHLNLSTLELVTFAVDAPQPQTESDSASWAFEAEAEPFPLGCGRGAVTRGGPAPDGSFCTFPFIWDGVSHDECTVRPVSLVRLLVNPSERFHLSAALPCPLPWASRRCVSLLALIARLVATCLTNALRPQADNNGTLWCSVNPGGGVARSWGNCDLERCRELQQWPLVMDVYCEMSAWIASYATRAEAEEACGTQWHQQSSGAFTTECAGVYDQSCDGQGPFRTCSTPAGKLRSSSSGGCVYSRAVPPTRPHTTGAVPPPDTLPALMPLAPPAADKACGSWFPGWLSSAPVPMTLEDGSEQEPPDSSFRGLGVLPLPSDYTQPMVACFAADFSRPCEHHTIVQVTSCPADVRYSLPDAPASANGFHSGGYCSEPEEAARCAEPAEAWAWQAIDGSGVGVCQGQAGGARSGMECELRCADRHHPPPGMEATVTARCDDGRWHHAEIAPSAVDDSTLLPQCLPDPCPLEPPIAHLQNSRCAGTLHGASCRFRCAPGFEALGTARCKLGDWELGEPAAECRAVNGTAAVAEGSAVELWWEAWGYFGALPVLPLVLGLGGLLLLWALCWAARKLCRRRRARIEEERSRSCRPIDSVGHKFTVGRRLWEPPAPRETKFAPGWQSEAKASERLFERQQAVETRNLETYTPSRGSPGALAGGERLQGQGMRLPLAVNEDDGIVRDIATGTPLRALQASDAAQQ